MTSQHPNSDSGSHIPESDRLDLTARRNQTAVRAEDGRRDSLFMPAEDLRLLSGNRPPDPDRAVVTARYYEFARRVECDGADLGRVTGERANLAARFSVPKLDRLVTTAGDKPEVVGAERKRVDARDVGAERHEVDSRADLPHLDLAAQQPRRQELAISTEGLRSNVVLEPDVILLIEEVRYISQLLLEAG